MPDINDPAGGASAQVTVSDPNADIHVDPSEIRAVLVTGMSMLAFAASFFVAIAGFVSKHDLAGAIVYLQNQQTIAGLTALAGVVLYLSRLVIARRRKRKEVTLTIRSPGASLTSPVSAQRVEEALSPPRAREPETRAADTTVGQGPLATAPIKTANAALNQTGAP